MVGPDARVDCEPGQVRKEAAISMPGPVPSVARPWLKRLTPDLNRRILGQQAIDSKCVISPVHKAITSFLIVGNHLPPGACRHRILSYALPVDFSDSECQTQTDFVCQPGRIQVTMGSEADGTVLVPRPAPESAVGRRGRAADPGGSPKTPDGRDRVGNFRNW